LTFSQWQLKITTINKPILEKKRLNLGMTEVTRWRFPPVKEELNQVI
jgi:hypothetical protein